MHSSEYLLIMQIILFYQIYDLNYLSNKLRYNIAKTELEFEIFYL